MLTSPPAFGKKTPYTLFSLPGFLGHPSDWKGLLNNDPLWEHLPQHYYDPALPPPTSGLRAWADTFNRAVATRCTERRLLLGYSLGGRLALHALCRAPELWSGAILISTHPGLPAQERASRHIHDEIWAQRFETEPFESTMLAWNSQALFDGTPFPGPRPSDSYDRSLISATLRGWSLSQQDDLTAQIATLPMPILWLVGARDTRYTAAAMALHFGNPLSRSEVIADAGHRLPWQQPEAFLTSLEHFCQQLQPELCLS